MAENDPMTQLLPLLLLSQGESDNTDNLMMMLMMNPQSLNQPNAMLPLMLMEDGDLDMKSMFLMTSMMQKDCAHQTNQQMNGICV